MKITYGPLAETVGFPLWACDRCGGAVAGRDAHADWHRANEGRGVGDASAGRGPSYTTEEPLTVMYGDDTRTAEAVLSTGPDGYAVTLPEAELEAVGLLAPTVDEISRAVMDSYRAGFSDRGHVDVNRAAVGLRPATSREDHDRMARITPHPFPAPARAVPTTQELLDTESFRRLRLGEWVREEPGGRSGESGYSTVVGHWLRDLREVARARAAAKHGTAATLDHVLEELDAMGPEVEQQFAEQAEQRPE